MERATLLPALLCSLAAAAAVASGAGSLERAEVATPHDERTSAPSRPAHLDEPFRLDEDGIELARAAREVLAANCYACHGPDAAAREADLRLDTAEGLATFTLDGAVVTPGDPEASTLLLRVRDETDPMPPQGHPALSAADAELLERWIAGGGELVEHWSFVRPQRPVAPAGTSDDPWVRDPLDAHVLSALRERGLEPSAPADRATWLRRASLDLIGLPPTPERVARFVADERPGAFERVVDELLADPAFGERWASLWLDLARYADTCGYGMDLPRTIWPWRDWVVDALNEGMPFDRFTLEQLAGDLLEDATDRTRLATAFHRNTLNNTEGGTDDEQFRQLAVKDRVDTTMGVWLGLSAGCASCHDHKFDPISQAEYYALFDLFNQTADRDTDDDAPTLSVVVGTDAAGEERRATAPVMVALGPDQRRTTHVHERGNWLAPGEVVRAGVPRALAFEDEPQPTDRLALARWIVDPRHPLTARVTVNRFWARLFGRGIVLTEEDFGTRGARPSHPELLDLLAVDFVEGGWNLKALLRRLVLSATYRQASVIDGRRAERDPDNTWLSRGPRKRLEAEMVRDASLAVSGLLDRTRGGPSVFPPQPPGLWQVAFYGGNWETSTGGDRYRRDLYTFLRRTQPYHTRTTFDGTSREVCTHRRVNTNTPLQALVSLNDPVFVEAAQALARRMWTDVPDGVVPGDATQGDAARTARGLELVLSRPADPERVEVLLELLSIARADFAQRPADALVFATDPLGPLEEGADPVEFAAFTLVANVLLNQDAFLTIE